MERETFTMKLEPEEDLEYILNHGEKMEIKSESDIIKSEESFKEVRDYQEPECGSWPVTFPPIKEELHSEIEPPIKSEQCYKEEVQDYQQLEYFTEPLTFPPIKDELPDELNASDNVDAIVKTEMKFCDDSQEINDFISYHDTPEDKAKSEIEPPIKSEQCYKEEVQDYQQLEYFTEPLTFPPIKDELPDELNASDNVDAIVKTEMKFCDDSQEINDFISYHDTPEDKAKVFKI
uniref:Uncharacterized protein n=1 Tax=Timema monikensis TaxID=170555 RepID=A0A7R9EEV9_9NEOP|nr:unnamed protein product [Timema monikensis]